MANQSLYDVFKKTAHKYPDKTAFIFLGKRFSYNGLLNLTEQLAKSLYHLGVREKDKVMMYLPHTPQWLVIWLALQRIGAVAVPFTTFYGPSEIRYIANDTGARVLFCIDTNVNFVIKSLADTPVEKVVVSNVMDLLPGWKKVIGKMYNKIPEGKYELSDNMITLKRLLKDQVSDIPAIDINEEDYAEILYTGGTTGEPKGVPISHVVLRESFKEIRDTSENLIPRGEDIVIQGAPLFHILGQVAGLGALFSGDTLVLLPRYNLDAVLEHIQRYKVKTLFGTPTAFRMIVEHPRFDHYDLSSLQYCPAGGDTLPYETGRKWKEKVGLPICVGYGITEVGGAVSLTPPDQTFPEGTCGKIMLSKIPKLVDVSLQELSSQDEQGELLVSSDNMVTGYWNKPEETESRFINMEGRLWYRTGDIVKIDQEGWIFFVDRSVDLIKHKGYRISASRVEGVLQEHYAVMACCVVGVPDENVGERIKAFVTVRTDIKGVSAGDLIQWCKKQLTAYEVPQYIEFRDVLPKSKVGKLLKRELRDDERRKMETS